MQWKLEHRDRSACSNLAYPATGQRYTHQPDAAVAGPDSCPSSTKSGLGKTLFGWQELSAALYPEPAGNDDDVFGYPSRCQTNESGRDGFLKAIRASRKLKGDEGEILASFASGYPSPIAKMIRMDWMPLTNLEGIKSKEGKQFAAYLLSA